LNPLSESELILNPDGSIYHLCLKPGELANIVFTVGDPQRVSLVSQHFDSIELERSNREFVVHTGWMKNTRVSVLSTGMGTDNIDIVWNEVDALFNIDFETRLIKNDIEQISWIRLGTSGSIQSQIPVGELVYTKKSLGLEGLMSFYKSEPDTSELAWQTALESIVPNNKASLFACDEELEARVMANFKPGYTATFGGFYAPQGRTLRADSKYPNIMDEIAALEVQGERITNMEMETAGIYGLAKILGHKAISLNAIIANRATGQFSSDSDAIVDKMIRTALNVLV
jgi:uridine phosphorylase